ncbi:MAG: MbcA/ParS/Xre antitoxin family protein [Paracoccaceae bacterium]
MFTLHQIPQTAARPDHAGLVLTRAVLRAADRLGLGGGTLAGVLGVSSASISRLKSGALVLMPGQKAFELGVLFVRLFRGLDALCAGDEALSRAWLRADNLALGHVPLDMIASITGLVDVVAYLDARRAPI